jgi:hypothetical protein
VKVRESKPNARKAHNALWNSRLSPTNTYQQQQADVIALLAPLVRAAIGACARQGYPCLPAERTAAPMSLHLRGLGASGTLRHKLSKL